MRSIRTWRKSSNSIDHSNFFIRFEMLTPFRDQYVHRTQRVGSIHCFFQIILFFSIKHLWVRFTNPTPHLVRSWSQSTSISPTYPWQLTARNNLVTKPSAVALYGAYRTYVPYHTATLASDFGSASTFDPASATPTVPIPAITSIIHLLLSLATALTPAPVAVGDEWGFRLLCYAG